MDNSTGVESLFSNGRRKLRGFKFWRILFMNIASNGIRIHVADQGKGTLAIVFLHGWGASTRTWEHVIAALPPGYRTVAIDQRGWGSSEQPASGDRLGGPPPAPGGGIRA